MIEAEVLMVSQKLWRNNGDDMKPQKKRVKVCPFLEKYKIPRTDNVHASGKVDLPQWMKDACLEYCPVYNKERDIGNCIFDYSGGVTRADRARLEKATLPCPHCGKYILHWLNEDGDWEFMDGYRMYMLPILPHRKRR